jgi:hypothetical protein
MRADKYLTQIFSDFTPIIKGKRFFLLSLLLALVGFILAASYYFNQLAQDTSSWLFWLTSVFFLWLSFLDKGAVRRYVAAIHKKDILFLMMITLFYFIARTNHINDAPWNSNGLFDDAAWDIYFAREYIGADRSFQIIFKDTFAYISRELVFHYYISAFFHWFGYNLMTFNFSLLFLGYITVLFTAFTAFRIFDNFFLGLLAGVLLTLLPWHLTQTFMGHRYAICTPIMMISLYYFTTAFKRKSLPRCVLGGAFAALCMESAIMGKQYIYSLIGFALLYLFFQHIRVKKKLEKEKINMVLVGALSVFIALLPLLAYILAHPTEYNMRESSLLKEFIEETLAQGGQPLGRNLQTIFSVLFAKHESLRQFMNDYPILPYVYWAALLPGIFLTFVRKRYDLFILSLLPTAGTLFTFCADFRIFLSAPIWILCITYTAFFVFTGFGKTAIRYYLQFAAAAVIAIGLVSSVRYITALTQDPNHLWLLPHKDIAVSRLIQDLVVGAKNPSSAMKIDEFNRDFSADNMPFQAFAATKASYAHVHLFLKNMDDEKILSLINNFPFERTEQTSITESFRQTISDYQDKTKGLRLILEVDEKIEYILAALRDCEKYGSGGIIYEECDGTAFSVYVIDIPVENVDDFKREILSLLPIENEATV